MRGKNKYAPVCPRCSSKDIRSRIRTKDYWCRRCGYIGKKEKFFKEINNAKI